METRYVTKTAFDCRSHTSVAPGLLTFVLEAAGPPWHENPPRRGSLVHRVQVEFYRKIPERGKHFFLPLPRRALVVLLPAAIVVAGAAAALVWWYIEAGSQKALRSFRYLPPGSTVAINLDLAGLRNNPMVRRLLEGQEPPQLEREYSEFVRATGFDFERDLDSVSLGISGPEGARVVHALLQGRFNRQKVEHYSRQPPAEHHRPPGAQHKTCSPAPLEEHFAWPSWLRDDLLFPMPPTSGP